MKREFETLAAGLTLRGTGADPKELATVAAALYVRFPADYVAFMLATDGAEGPLGKHGYVAIWPAAKLVALNEGYSVAEFAPGLVLFGSDGGNTGYAFDRRSPAVEIVAVPFVGMALEEAEQCGSTFADFLRHIAATPE